MGCWPKTQRNARSDRPRITQPFKEDHKQIIVWHDTQSHRPSMPTPHAPMLYKKSRSWAERAYPPASTSGMGCSPSLLGVGGNLGTGCNAVACSLLTGDATGSRANVQQQVVGHPPLPGSPATTTESNMRFAGNALQHCTTNGATYNRRT